MSPDQGVSHMECARLERQAVYRMKSEQSILVFTKIPHFSVELRSRSWGSLSIRVKPSNGAPVTFDASLGLSSPFTGRLTHVT